MIGKQVTLQGVDAMGYQYTGIVKSVSKLSGNTKVSVEIINDGVSELKSFAFEDITGVANTITENAEIPKDSQEVNTRFLEASNMIGLKAEFDIKDPEGNNYSGTVIGVTRDGSNINLSVVTRSGSDAQEFSLDKINKLFGY